MNTFVILISTLGLLTLPALGSQGTKDPSKLQQISPQGLAYELTISSGKTIKFCGFNVAKYIYKSAVAGKPWSEVSKQINVITQGAACKESSENLSLVSSEIGRRNVLLAKSVADKVFGDTADQNHLNEGPKPSFNPAPVQPITPTTTQTAENPPVRYQSDLTGPITEVIPADKYGPKKILVHKCNAEGEEGLCPINEKTGKLMDYPIGFSWSQANHVNQIYEASSPITMYGEAIYLKPYDITDIRPFWGWHKELSIEFKHLIGNITVGSVGDLSRDYSYSSDSGVFRVGVMNEKVSENFFRAYQVKSFRIFPRAKGEFQFTRQDSGDVQITAPNNLKMDLKMIRNGDFKLVAIDGVSIPDTAISHKDIIGFDPKTLGKLILVEDLGGKIERKEEEVNFDLPGYMKRFGTFTDKNGKSCKVQNSKLYIPLSKANDIVDILKASTDADLATFLKSECPDLDLGDLGH